MYLGTERFRAGIPYIGTGSTILLNASGTTHAAYFGFVSGAAVSAAAHTLWLYISARTGSPTVTVTIYTYDDTGALSSSVVLVNAVSVPGTGWRSFTTASFSLAANTSYVLVIQNAHGTPASNHFTLASESQYGFQLSNPLTQPWEGILWAGVSTTNGTSAIDTSLDGIPVFGLVFADGTKLGFGLYGEGSGGWSNYEFGNAYSFPEELVLFRIRCLQSDLTDISNVAVYNHYGATLYASAVNPVGTGAFSRGIHTLPSPLTLPANQRIYVLFTSVGATSRKWAVHSSGSSNAGKLFMPAYSGYQWSYAYRAVGAGAFIRSDETFDYQILELSTLKAALPALSDAVTIGMQG